MKNEAELHQGPNPQRRMLQRGDLLNLEGRLMEAGWSTQLIKRYDRAAVKAPAWRVKEWDYYLIGHDFVALARTVCDKRALLLQRTWLIDPIDFVFKVNGLFYSAAHHSGSRVQFQ